MKIFVIGGTGFLGYHSIQKLLSLGHSITCLSLPDSLSGPLFPDSVKMFFGNLHDISDYETAGLLKGHQAVVFSAGADDRTVPRAPAYSFFYNENVALVRRLIRSAKQAKVEQAIILGSYMAYFDRLWPDLRLSERNPYIRSRRAQTEEAFEEAGNDIEVKVLELPFIFGSMPDYTPLWAPLIRYLKSPFPIFTLPGGTNMVAVSHVAEAVAGALKHGSGGSTYLVGDRNVSWQEWFEWLGRLSGRTRKARIIPKSLLQPGFQVYHLCHKIFGREGGLNPSHALSFLCRNTFFDPEPHRQILGYGSGGLEEAFIDTISACSS